MPYTWNLKNVKLDIRSDNNREFDKEILIDGATLWEQLGGYAGYKGGTLKVTAEGFTTAGISVLKGIPIEYIGGKTGAQLYAELSSDWKAGYNYIYVPREHAYNINGHSPLVVGTQVKEVAPANNLGMVEIELVEGGTTFHPVVPSNILIGTKPNVHGYGVGDTFRCSPASQGIKWYAESWTSGLSLPHGGFQDQICTVVAIDMSINRVQFTSSAGGGYADPGGLGQKFVQTDIRYLFKDDVRNIPLYISSSGSVASVRPSGTEVMIGTSEHNKTEILLGSTIYWVASENATLKQPPIIDGWKIDDEGYVIDTSLSGQKPNQPCSIYTLNYAGHNMRLNESGGIVVKSSQIHKKPQRFGPYFWWRPGSHGQINGIAQGAKCYINTPPVGESYEVEFQGDAESGGDGTLTPWSELHDSAFTITDSYGGTWTFLEYGYLHPDFDGRKIQLTGVGKGGASVYVEAGDETGWKTLGQISKNKFQPRTVYAYAPGATSISLYSNSSGTKVGSAEIGQAFIQQYEAKQGVNYIPLSNGQWLPTSGYTTELKVTDGWTTAAFAANGAKGASTGYVINPSGVNGIPLNDAIEIIAIGDGVSIKQQNGSKKALKIGPNNIRTTPYDFSKDTVAHVYFATFIDSSNKPQTSNGKSGWYYITRRNGTIIWLWENDKEQQYSMNNYTMWEKLPTWTNASKYYTGHYPVKKNSSYFFPSDTNYYALTTGYYEKKMSDITLSTKPSKKEWTNGNNRYVWYNTTTESTPIWEQYNLSTGAVISTVTSKNKPTTSAGINFDWRKTNRTDDKHTYYCHVYNTKSYTKYIYAGQYGTGNGEPKIFNDKNGENSKTFYPYALTIGEQVEAYEGSPVTYNKVYLWRIGTTSQYIKNITGFTLTDIAAHWDYTNAKQYT